MDDMLLVVHKIKYYALFTNKADCKIRSFCLRGLESCFTTFWLVHNQPTQRLIYCVDKVNKKV